VKEIKDEGVTGFTLKVSNDEVSIHMPIENLKNGFELSPNNFSEAKVIEGKEEEFANWLVTNLLDHVDGDTRDNFIVEMLDSVFERAYEGAEDFVDYGDD